MEASGDGASGDWRRNETGDSGACHCCGGLVGTLESHAGESTMMEDGRIGAGVDRRCVVANGRSEGCGPYRA